MSVVSRPSVRSKPYKGPESYQSEDAALFFGRDYAAQELEAIILSSKMTLLHAQSGAGKTSLLNARVMPNLEAEGWTPVRIRLQDNPITSTRDCTLRSILPSPEAERIAIDRILEHLDLSNGNVPIETVLNQYDSLPVNDRRRRLLIGPVLAGGQGGDPDSLGERPYICRLLSACIDPGNLVAHYAAVLQGSLPMDSREKIDPSGITLSQLRQMVSTPDYLKAHRDLLNQLNVPTASLALFFRNLFQTYGQRRSRFALILIYDQFEELFTRFIDPGPISSKFHEGLPDWRLRPQFFEKLHELYGGDRQRGVRDTASEEPLPLRYVISIRSEYIAQLEPMYKFALGMEESSYRLRLLSVDQAKIAIREPAKYFGYGYSDSCYNALIKELTKEESFVEPAHLQIVCEKLWNQFGSKLPVERGTAAGPQDLPQIGLDNFTKLGGIKGILKSFFTDFLADLSEKDRLETLEMLEPLITTSGTRNIVEKKQLTHAPFRDAKRREKLLDKLIDRIIVRIERRLGGYFAEITHEFLISPILESLSDELYQNPDYNSFRYALQSMDRFKYVEKMADETDNLLLKQEVQILHTSRNDIGWTDVAVELMLRSAVIRRADGPIIQYWVGHLQSMGETPGETSKQKGTSVHGHDPFEVIAEYANNPNPDIRISAARALGAVAQPSYIDKLVAITVKDDTSSVREAGEQEILSLPSNKRPHLLPAFDRLLADAQTRLYAYALLGRLKNAGLKLRPGKLRSMPKVRLAFNLQKKIYPKRGWKLRSVGLVYGILSIMLLAAAYFIGKDSSRLMKKLPDFFSALYLSTIVTCWVASQRVFPVRFQPSHFHAVLVETLTAVAGAFLCGLVIFICTFSTLLDPRPVQFMGFLFCALTVAYAIFFGMVRLGTAMIPRVAGIKQFDVFIAKLLFAVIFGLVLVATVTYIVAHRLDQAPDMMSYLKVWPAAANPKRLDIFKETIAITFSIFSMPAIAYALTCIHIERVMKPVNPTFGDSSKGTAKHENDPQAVDHQVA